MLATEWEFLSTLINVYCLFFTRYITRLADWVAFLLRFVIYSFFLDDAKHNSTILYFMDSIFRAVSLLRIICPEILAKKICLLNMTESSILEVWFIAKEMWVLNLNTKKGQKWDQRLFIAMMPWYQISSSTTECYAELFNYTFKIYYNIWG